MWNGSVRSLSFPDQVAATARAGFTELSVTPLDWTRWVSDGLSSADMRALSAGAGVSLTHLDPLARWADPWAPNNMDTEKYPLGFFGFETDDFLRIGEAIGATSFTAISTAPAESVPHDVLTEQFAALCQRAAEHGMTCELEFIPLGWAVPDLATAWRIVRDADQANSGIVFDLWHFMRSASSLELLRTIPGERITSIQVSDADATLPTGRDPMDDCLLYRRPVGEGNFPVADIVAVLQEIGAMNRVGPEIFSTALDELDAETIANVCASSVSSALRRG